MGKLFLIALIFFEFGCDGTHTSIQIRQCIMNCTNSLCSMYNNKCQHEYKDCLIACDKINKCRDNRLNE